MRMNGTIKDLNETLDQQLKLRIMSFKQFQKQYRHLGRCTCLDAAVAHTDKVEKLDNGYKFYFDDGHTFCVYYTGEMQKDNGRAVKNYDRSSGRIRINHFNQFNTSMYPEKAIGIAWCILNNQMPESFDGLAVNVMDGSGNEVTAMLLGIPYNIKENNLEWTLNKRNSRHGQSIINMFRITGHVYKYSANDDALYDALDIKCRKPLWIRHYMRNNYRAVR